MLNPTAIEGCNPAAAEQASDKISRELVMDDSVTDEDARRLEDEDYRYSLYMETLCTAGDQYYSGADLALHDVFNKKGAATWRNLLRRIEGMSPAAIEAAYEQWERGPANNIDELIGLILAGCDEERLTREARKNQLELPEPSVE